MMILGYAGDPEMIRMQSNGDRSASTHTCTLHDSIAEVSPADWAAIVDERTDLAMDRRLIDLQQRTLGDQCRTWVALVRDGANRPVACACLCLFRVDPAISAHPAIRKVVDLARVASRRILTMNVLFCGLPVPAGASHLRFAPQADDRAALACLHHSLWSKGDEVRAHMIVFKEFDDTHARDARWLAEQSYIAGEVPPMHRLASGFRDFPDFLGSMRARYRAQVRRSLRKIDSGGFTIERHRGPQAIATACDHRLHELYERIWLRSRYKLERLPRGFFAEAARALGDDAWLTVIRGRHAPAGFTFSVERDGVWHNLYSGVDDSINGTGDILFNLFYADLALAFERGCGDIRLGQTADEFKARLGAAPVPLRFFVRARSSLVHAAFRTFSGALFPAVASERPRQVFRRADCSEALVTAPASAH